MTTEIAKKKHTGAYDLARPGDPGAQGEVRGGVNHSSREVGGSWKVELDG